MTLNCFHGAVMDDGKMMECIMCGAFGRRDEMNHFVEIEKKVD